MLPKYVLSSIFGKMARNQCTSDSLGFLLRKFVIEEWLAELDGS